MIYSWLAYSPPISSYYFIHSHPYTVASLEKQ